MQHHILYICLGIQLLMMKWGKYAFVIFCFYDGYLLSSLTLLRSFIESCLEQVILFFFMDDSVNFLILCLLNITNYLWTLLLTLLGSSNSYLFENYILIT